jgi:hypothetical protein
MFSHDTECNILAEVEVSCMTRRVSTVYEQNKICGISETSPAGTDMAVPDDGKRLFKVEFHSILMQLIMQ